MSERLTRRLGQLVRERTRAPAGPIDPAPEAGSVPTTERADLHATPSGRPNASASPADRAVTAPQLSSRGVTLDELLPGYELSTEYGTVFVHDTARGALDPGYARLWAELREAVEELVLVPEAELDPGFRAIRDHGIESIVFLDLETGGLAGQPVFLAGLLRAGRSGFHLRQLLARTYAEEAALLEVVRRDLQAAPVVVTYNGKTFDLPFLADRAQYHGLRWDVALEHLDLLHPARRRYRGRYPDCRLVTLEWFVCHRRRSGDVPGRDIPGRFHRFVREGDPTPLVPILHHNALDLITLAELLGHLRPDPPGPRFVPDDGDLFAPTGDAIWT